jgi:hypothetical protein
MNLGFVYESLRMNERATLSQQLALTSTTITQYRSKQQCKNASKQLK